MKKLLFISIMTCVLGASCAIIPSTQITIRDIDPLTLYGSGHEWLEGYIFLVRMDGAPVQTDSTVRRHTIRGAARTTQRRGYEYFVIHERIYERRIRIIQEQRMPYLIAIYYVEILRNLKDALEGEQVYRASFVLRN